MGDQKFAVNIDAEAVKSQYAHEQAALTRKNTFDTRNYLNVRLEPTETQKTLTIRLLPFDPKGGSPFHKVHMHTVKVNKELSPSGWKTFVCPTHNKKDGAPMGERCPFCELSQDAHEKSLESTDAVMKKKYDDISFHNHVSDKWIVRCIERGHEADGVKFWLFSSSRKLDGVYDKIMNLANQRAASAAKKGNNYSIFDLNNGMDLIVTVSKGADGKNSIQIIDEGMPSPLSEDVNLGMTWINDTKQWYDVYTVKSFEYMEIVAAQGIPYYDTEKGKFVDKSTYEKEKQEKNRALVEKGQAVNDAVNAAVAEFSTVTDITNEIIGEDNAAPTTEEFAAQMEASAPTATFTTEQPTVAAAATTTAVDVDDDLPF